MDCLYRNPENYKGIFNAINSYWMEGNTIMAIVLALFAIAYLLVVFAFICFAVWIFCEIVIQKRIEKTIKEEEGKKYNGRIGTDDRI